MRHAIRAKIQQALSRTKDVQSVGSCSTPEIVSTSSAAFDIDIIVDETITGGKSWKVSEIAERHNLSYWTVYRALKGKPGWLPFGRTVRVSHALYRSWIESTVRSGIRPS